MKVFVLLLPAVLILACNNSAETEETTRTDSAADISGPAGGFSEATSIKAADIPETIVVDGELKSAFRWADSLGDNIFYITVKGPYSDGNKGESEEEERSAEIHAFHYVKDTDSDHRLHWKFSDREISCPLDITTDLVPGSLTVTDLDNDGYFETKFQYALACRGDISPAEMKLVMKENLDVYTLTGLRWVEFGPEFKFDVNSLNVNLEKLPMLDDGEDALLRSYGRYQTEKYFTGAPPVFLEFARNEWIKYAIEKF